MSEIEHVTADCQCEGKVCRACGVRKCLNAFSPKQTRCKPCRNASNRVRYHNNLETERAYSLANYHRNKEKYTAARQANQEALNAKRRASYLQNRENVLQQQKAYRLTNAEKVRVSKHREYKKHAKSYITRARKYHQEHPEVARTYQATYREGHPDIKTAQKQRRRARVAQNGGHFSAAEWQELKAYYEYACACCGRKEPQIKLCADHVIPVSKGGSSYIENIQPLCKSCNSKKHNKSIDYRRLVNE